MSRNLVATVASVRSMARIAGLVLEFPCPEPVDWRNRDPVP